MKKQAVERMKLEIFDKDGMLDADDMLGFVHVPQQRILDCIEKAGKFEVNEVFECKKTDGSPGNEGEIYLQIMFLTREQITNGAPIQPIDFAGTKNDLEAELKKDQLKGEFVFSIKSATKIPKMDNSFLQGKKADPFCRIFLSVAANGKQ